MDAGLEPGSRPGGAKCCKGLTRRRRHALTISRQLLTAVCLAGVRRQSTPRFCSVLGTPTVPGKSLSFPDGRKGSHLCRALASFSKEGREQGDRKGIRKCSKSSHASPPGTKSIAAPRMRRRTSWETVPDRIGIPSDRRAAAGEIVL
jgi:hypothetical protein